jgi:hypothetical protein
MEGQLGGGEREAAIGGGRQERDWGTHGSKAARVFTVGARFYMDAVKRNGRCGFALKSDPMAGKF